MTSGRTTDGNGDDTPRGLAVTGVVPAAGVSRRMGRDKALLKYDGATFLSRVVDALGDGGCDRVLVVVGPDASTISDAARETGAEVLINPTPGDGPITSMRVALREVGPGTDAIAWLPLDFPLVTGAHVRPLLEAAARSDADLTLPVCAGKRGHPAVFRRSLFPELADDTLEGGARVVVHRHLDGACLLPFDDPAVVTDVDTPEAYSALLTP